MFLLFIFGIRGKACRRYSRNVVLIDNGVDGNGKVIVLSSLKFEWGDQASTPSLNVID